MRPDLRFVSDLEEAMDRGCDIAVASASLNYVPDPYLTIGLLSKAALALVIARAPLWPIPDDRVAIQHVSSGGGTFSYPTWFFSQDAFRQRVRTFGALDMEVEFPDDRAFFAGHYGTYRGVVVSTHAQQSTERQQ